MVSVVAPVNKKFKKRYEVIDNIAIYRHPTINHKGGIIYQIIEYVNAFLCEAFLSIFIFLKKPFQILHAANPPDNIFLISLLFKPFGVKLIFDHHDLAPELYVVKFNGRKMAMVKLLRFFEKLSCDIADKIISTNDSFKQHVIKVHKVKPEKIFIVRNDPDIIDYKANIKKNSIDSSDCIKVLYVGCISHQDGVDILIKALDILVNELRCKKVSCTIIGDGDALQGVKQLSDRLGLHDNITFTGYIYDRQLLNEYIKNADICLETAPDNDANRRSTFIKIMEYMAFGKAIVAFDLAETRVSVGDAAVLVDPGNINAFANALQGLIEDPAKRETLGIMAKNRIVNSLNWEESSKTLKSVYESLKEDRYCR